jgi:hypothetical protein
MIRPASCWSSSGVNPNAGAPATGGRYQRHVYQRTAFGGAAPLYITSLIALTGSNQVPSFYLIVTALIALIIVRERLGLPSAVIRVMIHAPDREDLVLQSPAQTGARSLRRGTGVARNRERRFELSYAGNWRWLITIGYSVVGSIESETKRDTKRRRRGMSSALAPVLVHCPTSE